MSSCLLQFNNISFGYSTSTAPVLKDLSLGVEANSVTAILGPNGGGKTTLLHLALGWLKPPSGEIHLDGKPLQSYSRRELGQWLGLVPQNEHIPFEFSLLEYVILGRAPHLKPLEMPGVHDTRVAMQSLERVGMASLLERPVTSLSGGEQQLVILARALTQQPRFLILDEPTSHLDLKNKIRLVSLLRELADSGVTILMTTHEPEVAAAIGTHLVLMRQGQILQQGPINDIFTREALSETYQVDVQVSQISGKKVVTWH